VKKTKIPAPWKLRRNPEAATPQIRLRGHSQAAPLAVNRHHLMNAAIVGVEKVTAVRNSLGVRGPKRTLRPLCLPHPPAVLLQFPNDMNSVLHLVFNTGGPCWN